MCVVEREVSLCAVLSSDLFHHAPLQHLLLRSGYVACFDARISWLVTADVSAGGGQILLFHSPAHCAVFIRGPKCVEWEPSG